MYEKGEITDLELTKIVAVTRLVTRPKKSMNVHEPKQMALLAGVNQLYAEIGINPRDCAADTEQNRGSSIESMRDKLTQMFHAAGCTKLHFDGVEGHLFMVAAIDLERR